MDRDVATITHNPIGRRAFLKGAGAGALVAASPLPDQFLRSGMVAALVERDGLLTATLHRPDDQLRLRFEFPGLVYESATNELIASGVGTPTVRIIHPAQHLSERPIPSAATPGTTPIEHRIGGPSRLVYQVDPPIPFTVASLLSLAGSSLVTTTTGGNPGDGVSMIEVPADLRLSPGPTSPRADVAPITFGSVTQLHRTILTPDGPIHLTAVQNARSTDGFDDRVPNAAQRTAITNASQASGPATARRLWLTPHGAWANLRGSWSTLSWIQHAVGGRDQFVEVVQPGALMPFGIPAAVISTNTREWRVDSGGGVVASLVGSSELVVLDDTVTFDESVLPFGGRAWPFRRVSVVAEGPLDLVKEAIVRDGTSVNDAVAWKVAQETAFGPYRRTFVYRATDLVGNEIEFNLPAVFVTAEGLADDTIRGQVEEFYRSGSDLPGDLDMFTRIRAGNDPVAFAPEEQSGTGRTTFTTKDIWIGVDLSPPSPGGPPGGSVPAVDRAEVYLPAEIQQGIEGGPVPTVDVEFPERWLEHGADPGTPQAPRNPDLGFLEVVGDPPVVGIGGQARAAMTPDVVAQSFNQTVGFGPAPTLDLPPGQVPRWRPSDAFGSAAKILKGVNLSDLVDPVDLFDGIPGIEIPRLRIDFLPISLPDKIEYTYEWCPTDVKSVENAGFIARPSTRLCVTMTTVVGLTPSITSGASVEFEVRDFTLQVPPLFPVIELDVAMLRASQPIGRSVEFDFDIEGWRLGGILEFLEPLVRGLSPGGDAFSIDIGSDAIDLDLTMPLPNINLGLLAIRNFAIGIGGDFPFSGPRDPLIRFAAGTQKAPITVRLLQFTGAFSCQLDFTAQGLDRVRVKIEISACLFDVDVVIASAAFTVGALIDFRLVDGEVTFVGELWASASFSVLGISAKVTIAATLSYSSATQVATARGEIRWEVSLLLGKASGTIPLGRIDFELGSSSSVQGFRRASKGLPSRPASPAGSGVGTGFGDQHSWSSWQAYRSKFAA